MKAFTKPREVDYFLYKGRTKEFEEWCESVGVVLCGTESNPIIRVRNEDITDVASSLPLTLYDNVCLPSCVIIKDSCRLLRMPEEHFYKSYDLPKLVKSEYFEPDYSDDIFYPVPRVREETRDYKVVYDPTGEKDGESFIDKIQVTKDGIPVTESLKQEDEELNEYVDKLARYYERSGQLWKDWMLKREWPDYQINPSHWVVKNTEELVKWARGRFVNDGKRRFVGTVTKTIRGGKPIVGRVWTEEGDKFVPEDPSYPTISLEALMSDVRNGYLVEI